MNRVARHDIVPLDEVHRAGMGDEAPRGPDEYGRQRLSNRSGVAFKTVAAFCAEYVPLSYTIEGIVRSASLYTLTAKTGAGKTAFNVVAALAVATGRPDILGREVMRGRVAYLACENPDDIRMRIKIAAYLLNIDLDEIDTQILILDRREKPEHVIAELSRLAKIEPFALILIDTLAGFYDGDNINDAIQGGEFMRRLRPLTRLPGSPSVVVSAHPIKNASDDSLVPYGSGAILNEIDGNLTLSKKPNTGVVSLHWQGKLRGLEFEPVPFRFEITGSPHILDIKNRQVLLPTLRSSSVQAPEDRESAGVDRDKALLLAMIANPGATIRYLAAKICSSRTSTGGRLDRLARKKLVEKVLGKWTATTRGREAVS